MAGTANRFIGDASCERNMSDEEAKQFMVELSLKLYPLYWLYFGCLPIPLTLITASCTIAYMLAICAAMQARRVSRKCYMLLLNRAIGDLVCCAFFFCCSAYLFIVSAQRFRADVLLIIATLCGGCYWTAMVSYVSLSVLKLFAVYQPLRYKKLFSMSHCLYLVAFSWLVYVLIVLVTLTSFALVEVPSLRKWSGCKRETCMHAVARAKNITLFIVYVFTLTVYGVTVALLKMLDRSSSYLRSSMEKRPTSRFKGRFPFWKLTLNVATFAVFNFFYIVTAILLMPRDQCSVVVYHPEMVGLIGIVWLSLLVRILIDAILGLCTDQQLRQHRTSGGSLSNTSMRNHLEGAGKVADRCQPSPTTMTAVCRSRSESVTRC
ncbi:hypothetical protein Tcan_16709 [Toxocara canis]|uniref:G-protein coupled receptors family 1 profile domain-containing protein n=1 Tax=Toxocara canis TaxID=6265 RepID=A0A0B2VB69_TOXCA|nr:hypothetical protein Tcan_16709 [Toxocara canis]